jgi:hypothetical protein
MAGVAHSSSSPPVASLASCGQRYCSTGHFGCKGEPLIEPISSFRQEALDKTTEAMLAGTPYRCGVGVRAETVVWGGYNSDALPSVNPKAPGLDIGSAEIWVCVPEDRGAELVQPFGTFILDLYALADWLATLPKPRQDRLCWKARRMPLCGAACRVWRAL